jgi:beta-N-acetylhexosaminidase
MRKILFVVTLLSFYSLQGQQWRSGNYHHPWSDSVLSRLSMREQIAQMMMVAAWSNKGPEHIEEIENLLLQHKIGGLIFFQGTPIKQAYLTNYYQQISNVPLLIGIDGEWGLAMRLQGMNKFPFQMTLGAANNDSLLYKTGFGIGKQCKKLGIHVNFAPDIDVNTNPENPIIGFRSFGESPYAVAHNGALMMKGMQDAGIMACAKHFPGHGDSKGDSHLELPYIGHDMARLEEVELHPFSVLFDKGVMSTMVGHLEIPALDSVRHRPSSLSPLVVNDLLKKEMGFQGLIFTDALNMQAVSRYYGAGYAEAAAVIAGNDILVFPENVPKAIEVIEEQVKAGLLDSTTIAERVRKILYFKMLAGLNEYQHINYADFAAESGNDEAAEVSNLTADNSITVVTDNNGLLPLPNNTRQRVALWSIGKNGNYIF